MFSPATQPSFVDTRTGRRVNCSIEQRMLSDTPPDSAPKGHPVDSTQLIQLASLLLFSLGANIPLGYLREGQRKFSLRWFVYIHLSIPFIIAARQACDFGWNIVPLTLGCAVAGQIVGSRLNRKWSQ